MGGLLRQGGQKYLYPQFGQDPRSCVRRCCEWPCLWLREMPTLVPGQSPGDPPPSDLLEGPTSGGTSEPHRGVGSRRLFVASEKRTQHQQN